MMRNLKYVIYTCYESKFDGGGLAPLSLKSLDEKKFFLIQSKWVSRVSIG